MIPRHQHDIGRRLRRIGILWFCLCLMVMMLLWHNVDPEGTWASTGASQGEQDRGSLVVRTTERTR